MVIHQFFGSFFQLVYFNYCTTKNMYLLLNISKSFRCCVLFISQVYNNVDTITYLFKLDSVQSKESDKDMYINDWSQVRLYSYVGHTRVCQSINYDYHGKTIGGSRTHVTRYFLSTADFQSNLYAIFCSRFSLKRFDMPSIQVYAQLIRET